MASETLELAKTDFPSVFEYVNCRCKPIELPKKHGDTFPITVIDGGSGQGKTQQALALLRYTNEVVYLNESEMKQPIYGEFDKLATKLGQGSYREQLRWAQSAVKRASSQADPFSCKALSEKSIQGLEAVVELVKCWKAMTLSVAGMLSYYFKAGHSGKGDPVLFVDEATTMTYDMLRFVSNLGRSLGWRVVLAGAGIAKRLMQAESEAQDAQRGDTAAQYWMRVFFLSTQCSTEFFDVDYDYGLTTCPIVSQLLIKVRKDNRKAKPWEVIAKVAEGLEAHNPLVKDRTTKLLWLSGAYLDSESPRTLPSFAIGSLESARAQYFEPALMTASPEREGPHLDGGNEHRLAGPLEFSLLQQGSSTLLIMNKKTRPTGYGLTNSLDRVGIAVSRLVQPCFARDPLLEVCLSLNSHLDRKEFQSAISRSREYSNDRQRVYEYYTFAALQLACRDTTADLGLDISKAGQTCKVQSFLRNVFAYLAIGEHLVLDEFSHDLVALAKGNKKQVGALFNKPSSARIELASSMGMAFVQPQVVENDKSKTTVSTTLVPATAGTVTQINKMLNARAPWLVPAASQTKKSPVKALAKQLKISELVPGDCKYSLDATAYSHGKEAPWSFDCRGHLEELSTHQACTDTMTKFKNRACHGLLIVSTTQQKSDCVIWIENNKFLRVAMRIGNHQSIIRDRRAVIASEYKFMPDKNCMRVLSATLEEVTVKKGSNKK